MRVAPERSPWLQLLATFGAFLLGPLAALGLSHVVAPDSGLVQGLSVFAFALVFAGGAVIWLGFGLATLALTFLSRWMTGRRRAGPPPGAQGRAVPPGYAAFVVLGGVAGLGLGAVAAWTSEHPVGVVVASYGLLGLGYGLALWTAAHHGYLPFDPEG